MNVGQSVGLYNVSFLLLYYHPLIIVIVVSPLSYRRVLAFRCACTQHSSKVACSSWVIEATTKKLFKWRKWIWYCRITRWRQTFVADCYGNYAPYEQNNVELCKLYNNIAKIAVCFCKFRNDPYLWRFSNSIFYDVFLWTRTYGLGMWSSQEISRKPHWSHV